MILVVDRQNHGPQLEAGTPSHGRGIQPPRQAITCVLADLTASKSPERCKRAGSDKGIVTKEIIAGHCRLKVLVDRPLSSGSAGSDSQLHPVSRHIRPSGDALYKRGTSSVTTRQVSRHSFDIILENTCRKSRRGHCTNMSGSGSPIGSEVSKPRVGSLTRTPPIQNGDRCSLFA